MPQDPKKELPGLAFSTQEKEDQIKAAEASQKEAEDAKAKEADPAGTEPKEATTPEIDPATVAAIAKEWEGWRVGQKRNLDQAKAAKEAARAEEVLLKEKLSQVEKERAEAQRLLKEAQAAITQASSIGDAVTAKKIAKLLVEDGIIEQKQADVWLQEKGLVKQIDPSEFPTLLRSMAQEEIAKVRAEEEERKVLAELQTAIQNVTTNTTIQPGRITPLIVAALKNGEADSPAAAAALLIKEFGKAPQEEPSPKEKAAKKQKGEDLPEIVF
jgi:hypothetical protein